MARLGTLPQVERRTANSKTEDSLQALVLAGGRGTRLLSVTRDGVAKQAVIVNGRPFVDYVLGQIRSAGISEATLLLGHRADSVVDALRRFGRSGLDWTTIVEDTPLGTAGCLARFRHSTSARFLVVNGDTYVTGLKIADLIRFHLENNAAMTLALVRVSSSSDYGTVRMDQGSRVIGFVEKGNHGEGLVNSGIYIIERDVLGLIPLGKMFSMEQEFIPLLIKEGVGVYGYPFQGGFFDIGTPERLAVFERAVRSGLIGESSASESAPKG